MFLRFLANATAAVAAAVWLIVLGYAFVSMQALLAGDTAQIIVLLGFAFFLILLSAVFVAMINEAQNLEVTNPKPRLPGKLRRQLHKLISGSKDEKLSLLNAIDARYPPGYDLSKTVVKNLIKAIELESDETVRQLATQILIKASHVLPCDDPYRFVVDGVIFEFLRLRALEESSAEIRMRIFNAFGQLYTRYDSPGGPINIDVGRSIVRTLVLAFQREANEKSRIAAFDALRQLWCLDLECSETVVRNAMSDQNPEIRETAAFAVEYAYSDEY